MKAEIWELEIRKNYRLCNNTSEILLSAFLSLKVVRLGYSLEIITIILSRFILIFDQWENTPSEEMMSLFWQVIGTSFLSRREFLHFLRQWVCLRSSPNMVFCERIRGRETRVYSEIAPACSFYMESWKSLHMVRINNLQDLSLPQERPSPPPRNLFFGLLSSFECE